MLDTWDVFTSKNKTCPELKKMLYLLFKSLKLEQKSLFFRSSQIYSQFLQILIHEKKTVYTEWIFSRRRFYFLYFCRFFEQVLFPTKWKWILFKKFMIYKFFLITFTRLDAKHFILTLEVEFWRKPFSKIYTL